MVKVKTVKTNYIVKLNNEISEIFDSLRKARQHIKSLAINDDLYVVHIIKQTVNESVLATYETKVTKILTITDLDKDLLEEGDKDEQE